MGSYAQTDNGVLAHLESHPGGVSMRTRLTSLMIFSMAIGIAIPLGVFRASPASADTLVPFTALLNGAQETPQNNSPSQGVALVLLVKETNMVCYRLSYSPLSSTELVAHFHINAA